MKKMILGLMMITGGAIAAAAQTTTPVYLNYGNNQQSNAYANYSQQGNAMYHNNSQWYNKDNVSPDNAFPTTNGQYIQPGNSNPINNRLYDGNIVPGGTHFGTAVPPTDAGTNPSSGSEAYIRD